MYNHGPVGLFRKKVYKRSDTLADASKAHAKGNKKKAIREYRKVLEHEPSNEMVLSKLAGLLAETKQLDEAREKFFAAAHGFEKRGFTDKAIATYAVAVRHLPKDLELVNEIAGLHLAQGRDKDAIKALLDARKRMNKKRERPLAIALLRRVGEIEPWHFEGTFDLARLLARSGETDESRALLEGLAERNRKGKLRRVRGVLFRSSPGAGTAWRWLRAAVIGS